MIYFDNAASSYPKPHSVSSGVYTWISHNGANPGRSGHTSSIEASEAILETRERISDIFGIDDPEKIIFVPNATYGLNMIIQGLLSSGDHAVTTDLEHNSVLRPLNLLKNKGVNYSVARVDLYDDDVTVSNILKLIKSNTKAVICTQCSNVCGKIMPLKKIADAIPESVSFVVDGSQGAGIIDTDIMKTGIDYYCAPSHKSLLGPQGAGFIAVLSDGLKPIIVGGTGSESFDLNQPDYLPDKFESGTLATPVIVGLNEGLKYIQSRGIQNIFKHKKMLTEYFYDRINSIPETIKYIDYDLGNFVGTACFNVEGRHSDDVALYLSDNGVCVRSGIHCAPLFHKKMNTEDIGMVRVSFGCFNKRSEIDFFIKILKKYIKN